MHEELRQAMRVGRYMVKHARHEEAPRWGPGEMKPSHVVELLFAPYFEEEWPPRWDSEEHTEFDLRVMNSLKPVAPRHISFGSEPPTEPWTVVAIADDEAGVVHVLGYTADLKEPYFSKEIPVPEPPPEPPPELR